MASSETANTPEATTADASPTQAATTADAHTGEAAGSRRAPRPVADEKTVTPLERARISCEMNARYHACREAHLDTTHRWFMFGIIVFGAAAFVDVLPHDADWIKGVLSAGAAILGALDLTFDLSNRARTHALMRRRYLDLLADVIEGKRGLQEMQATINRFNADEEPAFHALIGTCWNAAQKMVYGDAAMALKIPRHHLLFKNIFRYNSSEYRP